MLKLILRPEKSKYWYVRGTIHGQEIERSTKCTKKADARKWLDQFIKDQNADKIAEEGITFVQAAAVYLSEKPEPDRLDDLLAFFGDMPVANITNAVMRSARNRLMPGLANSTVRRHLYTPVKAILHAAEQEDLCVAPKLKAPKEDNVRTHFFLPDQVDALITELMKHPNKSLGPLVTFLIGQGARCGEAFQLETEDISLDHKFAILRDTKNGEERRITLIPRVVAALSTIPTINEKGHVFRRRDGSPIPTRDQVGGGGMIGRPFRDAVKAIGLKPANYTPHTCRHTWATWFYSQTKDVVRLMDEGGWKSTLWRRYTKLSSVDLGHAAFEHGWDFREIRAKFVQFSTDNQRKQRLD